MKRNLLIGLAALAAVTITSCQKDQVINQVPQEQAIEFGTYVGRDAQTKATSIHTAELLQSNSSENGIGVYAYYTNNSTWDGTITSFQPNFMKNQNVTYSEGNWTYTPVKYWPNEEADKLSFLAYYPYSENTQLDQNGCIVFTLADNVKAQYDLMYNNYNNTELKNLNKQNLNEKVTFNFAHALSRIGFQVAAAVDATSVGSPISSETTITVTEVKLTFNGAIYNTANFNIYTGTWQWPDNNGTVNDKQFTWKENVEVSNPVSGTFKVENAAKANVLAGAQTLNQLNADDSYLMIPPQNVNITIQVKYIVSTIDSGLGDSPNNKIEVENVVKKDVGQITLTQGSAYTFNLVLGMNSVDFSATVANWATGTTTDVYLPENQNTPQPQPQP